MISDRGWRAHLNWRIKETLFPAGLQQIEEFLLESLRKVDVASCFKQEQKDGSASLYLGLEPMVSPDVLAAAALGPNLAPFYPSVIKPLDIYAFAKRGMSAAAKTFTIERGKSLLSEEETVPRIVLDASFGITDVQPVLEWIGSRCQINLVAMLEQPGVPERRIWFYDLVLQLGHAQTDRIVKAALKTYGYPPPEPARREFLNEKMSKRIRARIAAIASKRIRKAVRAVVSTEQRFSEPHDLGFPGTNKDGSRLSVDQLRARLPYKFANCPELELRQAWDTEVAAQLLRHLGSSGDSNPMLWICESLRVVELRDPDLASKIRRIEHKSRYRSIRAAIYDVGERHDAAVNGWVENSLLDELRDLRRPPEALLEKLGLDPGCRLVDRKWRETVAHRFYRETEYGAHGLDGFEDIIEELGIIVGGASDTWCGCRFYGEKKAQREFLMRNHWCTKGKLFPKAASERATSFRGRR